jgi:hypothetical protein
MQSFAVYLYVTAVGFVTAGLLTSFVQLISGQPMRFGIEPCSVLASVGAVLLRVLAGPAILMRNAWRGIRIEARPKGWFVSRRRSRRCGVCYRVRCCST